MAKLLIWTDKTRFASEQLNNWRNQAGLTPDLASTVSLFQTGLYTSSAITYSAPNQIGGDMIIGLLDRWHNNAIDTTLDILFALTQLGVVTGYINPSSVAAVTPTTISAYGQGYVAGATVTVSGHSYAATVVSANELNFGYDGTLPAGVYDVTVTNTDGSTGTFYQSLTLT